LIDTTLYSIACRPSKLHFVDFGSGKGRVVFHAALNGCGHTVGIEVEDVLHQVALRNRSQRALQHVAEKIELLNQDAASYQVPHTDCVLNFYNPVSSAVFACVFENAQATHREFDNKMYIAFQESRNEPAHSQTNNIAILESADWLRSVDIRFPSVWSKFLLSHYRIKIFETR
ncbi:MAG: hypothetical protein AAF420_09320, partial [Pseudomonadota bacterium]